MCVDLITYSSFSHVLSVFTFAVNDTSTTARLLWGSAWCRFFPSFVPWFNSVICLILISLESEPLKWRTKEIKKTGLLTV